MSHAIDTMPALLIVISSRKLAASKEETPAIFSVLSLSLRSVAHPAGRFPLGSAYPLPDR